jgi:uncharacterized protein YbaP (TraB family)
MRPRLPALIAVLIASWALGSAAWAQEPPAPSPATLVEEVEVIGRLPGPALWRVSTTDSQIWLLGLASPLPRDFKWNDERVAKALDGARELIIPPTARVGLGDVIGLLIDSKHLVHLPPGQTVRDGLPPDLRARWEEAARGVGRDPAHYDHWRPEIAALVLAQDAERRNGLDHTGAQTSVSALARRLHVKSRRLADYRAIELLEGLSTTPAEGSQACLSLAADAAITLKTDAPRLAQAWAKGDLATVRALNDRGAECVDRDPPVAALLNRMATDWAKDLKVELAKPGKVMVAADLDTLTRKGGLLDQLQAEGLEVIGPGW